MHCGGPVGEDGMYAEGGMVDSDSGEMEIPSDPDDFQVTPVNADGESAQMRTREGIEDDARRAFIRAYRRAR